MQPIERRQSLVRGGITAGILAVAFGTAVSLLAGCSEAVPSATPAPQLAAVSTDHVSTLQLERPTDSETRDVAVAAVESDQKTEDSAGDDVRSPAADPPTQSDSTDDDADESRYEFRELHDPDGIGKFYMGREIAQVMGFGAASWLERPRREKEEATSKMIKELKLKPGMVVADVGAGSGVLTLLLAKKVGNKGKVVAVDVQQEMLDLLAAKLKREKIDNVELVKGTVKSPKLPKASLDLALMVDVYHEFEFPYEMMRELSQAMKPEGRIVFVEFRMEDEDVPIKLVHKMTQKQVKKEISLPEFRLKWKETIGVLPWQHIIVFERQEK